MAFGFTNPSRTCTEHHGVEQESETGEIVSQFAEGTARPAETDQSVTKGPGA
jgi:hypothetical protein